MSPYMIHGRVRDGSCFSCAAGLLPDDGVGLCKAGSHSEAANHTQCFGSLLPLLPQRGSGWIRSGACHEDGYGGLQQRYRNSFQASLPMPLMRATWESQRAESRRSRRTRTPSARRSMLARWARGGNPRAGGESRESGASNSSPEQEGASVDDTDTPWRVRRSQGTNVNDDDEPWRVRRTKVKRSRIPPSRETWA